MQTYTLETVPPNLVGFKKIATIEAEFISVPFKIDTQEGIMEISPDTVDDWKMGYYVAYPSDGSKPYAISPGFMGENYKVITPELASLNIS